MESEKPHFIINDIQNFQDITPRTVAYYREIFENNRIDSGYQVAKEATFNNIWKNVSEIKRILQKKDIFEVITAWKIYEKICSRDIKSGLVDCSPLALEILTMIASSLQENPEESKFYDLIYIVDVWSLAHEVVISLISLYECYQQNEKDSFERLSERYCHTSLNIRQNQYSAIRNRIEDSLLLKPLSSGLFESIFKASWNDFKKIREAIYKILNMKFESVIRKVNTTLDYSPNNFIICHDDILQFDSLEISRETGLAPAYIGEVLDNFVYFSTNLKNDLSELFDGKNPFIDKPLIKSKDKYMLTNINIGEDNILNLFESKMSQKDKQKYDKNVRSIVTEKMTGEIIESILGNPRKSIRYFHEENYHYLYPKKDGDIYELGIEKSKADNEFEDCEGDHLYLYGNVLLIVEVKAKMYNPKTRRGDSKRLKSELKATIRNGDAQADRVEKIINANEGIWIKEGSKAKSYKWRDISSIKRIYKMIVTLDGLGSLGLEVNEMFIGSLLSDNKSLVISLYDLHTIKDTIEKPYNFIAYLELRRYLYEKNIKGRIFGFSEKDLYGFFLSGGLNKIIQRGLEYPEDIHLGSLDDNISKYYSELEKGRNQNLTIIERSKFCKDLSDNIIAAGEDECLLISSFISLLMEKDESKIIKSINKIKKSHFPSKNKRYFSIIMDNFRVEILLTGENEEIENYLRKRRNLFYDTYIIYFDSNGYVRRVSLFDKNKL